MAHVMSLKALPGSELKVPRLSCVSDDFDLGTAHELAAVPQDEWQAVREDQLPRPLIAEPEYLARFAHRQPVRVTVLILPERELFDGISVETVMLVPPSRKQTPQRLRRVSLQGHTPRMSAAAEAATPRIARVGTEPRACARSPCQCPDCAAFIYLTAGRGAGGSAGLDRS